MNEALPATADVVIVGAGMAGLSAAVELTRRGLDVVLVESADRPGGRVATDVVDGFRLDRGFQLLNPSYPRLRRLARDGVLDLDALQLQQFDAAVRVALDGRHAILADPRRHPGDLLATVRAPVGSLAEKARFAAWAARCALGPGARLANRPDETYFAALDRGGVTGGLRTAVVEPFLAGVLGDDRGETSANMVGLLMRAFIDGRPGVPAWGMGALPAQLAAALPPGCLRLGVHVQQVHGNVVRTLAGSVTARAVLVATDPPRAAALLGLPEPRMRALTTFWYVAPANPCRRPILHLDGLRRGPVVNAAVMSAAAPSYSPDGRGLIGATVVGEHGDADSEVAVRGQLRSMFGTENSRVAAAAGGRHPRRAAGHAAAARAAPERAARRRALRGRRPPGHRIAAGCAGLGSAGRAGDPAAAGHLNHSCSS